MKHRYLPVVCGAFALACCSSEEAGPDLRGEVIDSLVQDMIVPGYEAAGLEADALALTASAFCDSPDETGLQAVQAAWDSVRGAWKVTEVVKFGPVVEFPGRYGSKIDFWPARPDNIEDLLSADSELTADALDALGTSVRGLPVIEYLLFHEATVQSFTEAPRRCEYLVAATEDVSRSFVALIAEWEAPQTGWAAQMLEPGGESMYMDDQEVLGELGNRMWFTVENIRAEKLRTPLGDAESSPQLDKVESPYAERSIEDILDNLRGVETAFFGPETTGMGFDDLLEARGSSTADRVREAMDASISCVDGLERPLSRAIESSPDAVEACIDELTELQRIIQTDVIGELGLSLNFNDADGD